MGCIDDCKAKPRINNCGEETKKRICKVKRLEKGGGGAGGTGRGAADAQLSTRCCCCRV